MRGRRILWLDGLKGLACMFVFVHHFLVGFYPAAYFGEGAGAHIARFPGLEAALASSPIAFLVNGHFLVCVFCVVSGAVLGARMLSDPTPAAAGDMMLRRYFRFALPVFAVQSIAFVMSRTGLFFSGRMGPELVGSAWLSGYFAEPIAISRLFVSSFVTTEFVGDNLIGVTWMLYQMFIGGLLSMLLCLFGARSRRGALAAACLWAAGLLFRRDMYACFALGALLAMLQRPPARGAASKAAFALAVAGGGILGGYPPAAAPAGVYRLFSLVAPASSSPAMFWHQIGAFLLLLGLGALELPQRVLSCRPLLFLGRISFSVYLVHFPIICSLSCFVFLRLTGAGVSYNRSALAAFALTVGAVLLAGWAFWRFIERPCGRLTRRIAGALERRGAD